MKFPTKDDLGGLVHYIVYYSMAYIQSYILATVEALAVVWAEALQASDIRVGQLVSMLVRFLICAAPKNKGNAMPMTNVANAKFQQKMYIHRSVYFIFQKLAFCTRASPVSPIITITKLKFCF